MTFAEYNTDANFDNSNSSLDELVRIGVEEGKNEDEIRNSLSAKWKNSKKINELSSYFQKHSANKNTPKAEEKAENKIVEEKPQKPFVEKEEAPAPKQSSETANRQNNDLLVQQQMEKQTAMNNKSSNWDNVIDSARRLGAASKTVDDHYIESLPKTIRGAYKAGEFGKVGSTEAKQRLGYFVMDALSSPLKALANGFSRFAGQGDRFADTESQWEKLQKTNLGNAMENRWNKYKQETSAAMDLIKQRGFEDDDVQEAIDKVSANNRLQTAFNRATEDQKAYVLEVMTEIGDKIGNMNDTEFVQTLMGMSAMGDKLDYKEAAGMLVYRFIKDPEKRNQALSELGVATDSILGGLGGGILGGLGNGEKPGPSNNNESSTSVTLSDGTVVDPGKFMMSKDYQNVINAANKLSNDYKAGKITYEQYKEDYKKLEDLINEHKWTQFFIGKIKSFDEVAGENNTIKQKEIKDKIDELNKKAKKGDVESVDAYNKEFNALKEEYIKYGGKENKVSRIDVNKIRQKK